MKRIFSYVRRVPDRGPFEVKQVPKQGNPDHETGCLAMCGAFMFALLILAIVFVLVYMAIQ